MGNEVIFIVSVIALIFYLVISKFLKNNIKDNYFRIFIGLIISIMFGIIFYVFSVAGLIYFLTKEKSRDFDKKDWILLNEDIEKRLHRYEMIDDLIDSRVLIDKDSIQVKELLGKPNYKNSRCHAGWKSRYAVRSLPGIYDAVESNSRRNRNFVRL